jgi:hypothetical protein
MSETEKKRSSRTSHTSRSSHKNLDDEREDREERQSRSRSKKSESEYGGTISDIENTETNYYKIAKKLTKDKSNLKDKLRRLLDEIDTKSKDHRLELEKTQDYFQEQITELVEEKEKLSGIKSRIKVFLGM